MKYIDEYRDAAAAKEYAQILARVTTKPWTLMEICGGQTHAIMKYGVDELLPPGLQGEVRAGPLDDTAWVLLVDHASGAAKLRQLLPNLERALVEGGRVGLPIKIRVLPRG